MFCMVVENSMRISENVDVADARLYTGKCAQLFHDGGPYHIETSPLICRANQ